MAKIDQFVNGEGGFSVRSKINEAMKTVEVTDGYFTGDGTVSTPLVGHWSGDTTSITYSGYLQLTGVSAPTAVAGRLYSGTDGHLYYSSGDTFIQIDSPVISGQALTKSDDTNVTLTLGGSPETSLLAETSITVGWSGTLAQSRGGTGVSNGGELREKNTFTYYTSTAGPQVTGSYNVYLGDQSVGNNQTSSGSYNISIGANAGWNITSATDSVFLGRSAGNQNRSKSGVVAIGSYSGNYLEDGSSGVFVGYRAGMYSDGGNNTFIGYESGRGVDFNNKSYGSNVGIGHQSLYGLKSGANYNIGIGCNAGDSITTGDNNVLVGYQAGTTMTTAIGNVFLGYQAGYNETGSNKLYISNSNADANNALIYGEFDTGFVRFNGYLELKAISEPTATNGLLYVNSTDNHLYYSNDTTYIKLSDNIINSDNLSSLQEGDLLSYDSINGKFINIAAEEFDLILNLNQANITGNQQLSLYVPAGYLIDSCVIVETSGNSAGDISLGISGYTSEIIENYTIDASVGLQAPLGQEFFSMTEDTDLWVSSTSWGTGIINIYLLLKKII